jgi:hypothetical protein
LRGALRAIISSSGSDVTKPGTVLKRAYYPVHKRQGTQWFVSFILFAAAAGLWALATPIDGAPDEASHVIRAASVSRGELLGQRRAGSPDYYRYVRVPGRLVKPGNNPFYSDRRLYVPCFAFQPEVSAECFGALDSSPVLRRAATDVGLNPPALYAVVGLPSLIFHSAVAIYLMRMMSVLLCAALLASALFSLRTTRPSWLGAAGLAVAVTPTALFLAGTVNPNGIEIAAGIGAWSSLVPLVHDDSELIDSRLVRRAAIALSVLVLGRSLGLLWAALIIFFAAGAFGTRPAVRRLAAFTIVRRWAFLVMAAASLAVAWLIAERPLSNLYRHGPDPGPVSVVTIAKRSLGGFDDLYRQMVGTFGWLDTSSPIVTYALWTAAISLVVVLALAFACRRHAALVAALVALTIALPVAIDTSQARRMGLGWQGRWTLPFAVGVPIAAALALAWSGRADLAARSRLPAIVAVGVFAAQFFAFGQALRRNTVGANGSLDFWRHSTWQPPVPAWFLLAAYALVLGALAAWMLKPYDGHAPSRR